MDDRQIQQGYQWLEELLRLSGLPAQVEVDDTKLSSEGSCWLTINDSGLTPEQIDLLIGEKGSVLDAIQYLANTTLNLGQSEDLQVAYTVELSGYRLRRQAELQTMSEAAVDHVRSTGEEYEMAALSAAERRQVHTYLKAYEDLETYSRGKEPDRRLVVRPVQHP